MKDRKSERIEFLQLNGTAEPTLFDLSKTGVCAFSMKKLEKGAFAFVKINTLRIKAQVVYCQDRTDGFRVGMQFCELTPEQKTGLGDLVDKFSRGIPISSSVES
jgi:PilZ domain